MFKNAPTDLHLTHLCNVKEGEHLKKRKTQKHLRILTTWQNFSRLNITLYAYFAGHLQQLLLQYITHIQNRPVVRQFINNNAWKKKDVHHHFFMYDQFVSVLL